MGGNHSSSECMLRTRASYHSSIGSNKRCRPDSWDPYRRIRLYLLRSVTGVTGSRQDVSDRGLDLIQRVKGHTSLPLAVGFGISSREHVLEVCNEADAAVVGSALIRTMLDSPEDKIIANVADLVSNLSGKKS